MISRIQSIVITSGRLVVGDPAFVCEPIDLHPCIKLPDNVPYYDNFGGDGTFRVFTNDKIIVIDTAPRQFKAKSRQEFCELNGTVGIDTGRMSFFDATKKMIKAAEKYKQIYFLTDVPNGEYKVWQEVNENSRARQDRILCFGPQVELIITKPLQSQLVEIEKQVTQALRLKGKEKITRLEKIRKTLAELHLSGVKDPRLRMLADAVKMKLPRRTKRSLSLSQKSVNLG